MKNWNPIKKKEPGHSKGCEKRSRGRAGETKSATQQRGVKV
jgi:hypothetical protein